MNIAFFTNTYLPHVGGVARSVSSFAEAYRAAGHRCLIFAPEFDEREKDETDVVRVPAITNFNDSGFSVSLPVPGLISEALDAFEPDVVHSHHPFLLGDAAMRAAYRRDLPLVFTHHTLYERYTGYLSMDNEFAQRAISSLATQYANACNLVFAPSRSLADTLFRRGVKTKIEVQPTGIDFERFASGEGRRFRERCGIASDAFLLGHVGRLAREKNLRYLLDASLRAARERSEIRLAVVGDGQDRSFLQEMAEREGPADRAAFPGSLAGQDLCDAYAAFDLFVFASQSETQGLVLAEAMASGTPVIALDGPGVRDIVSDGKNGRMLPAETSRQAFSESILELADGSEQRGRMGRDARDTARSLSIERMADQALERYRMLISGTLERWARPVKGAFENLAGALGGIEAELELIRAKVAAATSAINGSDDLSSERDLE